MSSERGGGDRRRRWGGREPRVERLALELDRLCAHMAGRMKARARAHSEQLQKASASVLANIGEAFDELHPAEQARFFDYARRSAGEAERLLKAGRGRGVVVPEDFERGMRLLRDIKMDLFRLIAWTRRQP